MESVELKSILDVTMQQAVSGEVSEATVNGLRMRALSAAGITTPEALMRRMHECIHAHSMRGIGCRMVTLNRQYSRVASKCGTTVNNLVADLLHTSKIIEMDAGGVSCVYSKSVWDERVLACIDVPGFTVADMRDRTVADSR